MPIYLKGKTKNVKSLINNQDYCLTSGHNAKHVIEFNVDYWHANPLKYKSDFEVGRSRKTTKEIREADARKIQLAESHGYEVKIVWESEYKKNPKKL